MSHIAQAREPYTPYRFTVDDYYRMAAADILTENARVELIDGQILVKEPAGPQHAGHSTMLEQMFVPLLIGRALVRSQCPLHIDELNNPEPDVAIVKPRDDFYMHAHPRPNDVLLAIEIAWTSAPGDRRIKVPLYGRAGILELWLIDIPNGKLEVYRDPYGNSYRRFVRLNRESSVTPLAFPDLELKVAEMLRPR